MVWVQDHDLRPHPAIPVLCLSALIGAAVPAASAQTLPDYGFDWATVTDVGNRDTNATEAPLFDGHSVGGVNYTYRISKTEMTAGQWFEFVNAYTPYYDGNPGLTTFKGQWIGYDSINGTHYLNPAAENFATVVNWRLAARYCNWLHNGKVNEQWAFESGAYDTSTFGVDENNDLTDQRERSPGAKFWIPSLDEWVKAMYWDPAKDNGEGEELGGYWKYPTSSDEVPVSGVPGVGETSAGTRTVFDVGSYTDVTSPWGLFDGSGGEREWLETLTAGNTFRMLAGTDYLSSADSIALTDRIDKVDAASVLFASGTLRIAGIVPSPGTSVLVAAGAVFFARRRRD
ncbi:MAG: hypothetical protein ACI89L_000614 [Phycisphaerales bacterium]|jgi:hypothetical protein